METWKLTWTKLNPFNKESIDSLSDDIAGIYRLSYESDDGKFYVFYVDQCENLKKKLLEYLEGKKIDICISNYLLKKKCFFRYEKVAEEDIRRAAKKQMYKKYEPICNEIEPEGEEGIRVNLT